MRIREYLLLEGKKEDLNRWKDIVMKCNTPEELDAAIKMGKDLYKKHGGTLIDNIKALFDSSLSTVMLDIINSKRDEFNQRKERDFIFGRIKELK